MQRDQIQRKLDTLRAEYDQLHREMASEEGFLISDPRMLRLQDLWRQEDLLEEELFQLDLWED